AGILLGMFSHHQITANSLEIHQAFLFTYVCIALIIALPALVFLRVPDDTLENSTLERTARRRKEEP
ncbi:MAG: multidrug transporter subunit MdtD, partial [Enterobacterales bacterium]|nr:multidrug transporter subunit MdtD [Enterobacterales bacterium]